MGAIWFGFQLGIGFILAFAAGLFLLIFRQQIKKMITYALGVILVGLLLVFTGYVWYEAVHSDVVMTVSTLIFLVPGGIYLLYRLMCGLNGNVGLKT